MLPEADLLIISSYLSKWSHNQVLSMPERGWDVKTIKDLTNTQLNIVNLKQQQQSVSK